MNEIARELLMAIAAHLIVERLTAVPLSGKRREERLLAPSSPRAGAGG
jgi:hypothetical protein